MIGAFPSTNRVLLWRRLRELGLRGAGLRILVALFLNDARIGGVGGGLYSRRVTRRSGVPEGFRLSPLLFALAFSPLIECLKATGAGVHVSGEFLGALMLADDVAIVAESAGDLRALYGDAGLALYEPFSRPQRQDRRRSRRTARGRGNHF